jgi:hypothetical protein
MKINLWISLVIGLIIFIGSLVVYADFSVMGVQNAQVQEYILKHYLHLVIGYNLLILAAYLLIALAVGFFSAALKIKKPVFIIGLHLFIWLFVWLRAVKIYPQLFCAQLQNKSGLGKGFQNFITDHVPLVIIVGLPVLLLSILIIRRKSIAAACLLLVFVLFFLPLQPLFFGQKNSQTPTQPNVLILASDSLRPDHISYNGYQRKTPAIDQLFSKGINFLKMNSSLAKTFPSWTSILTSQYPFKHNIRHMFPTVKDRQLTYPTLILRLNALGYETSVVSDFAGDIFSRIDYGFQNIHCPTFNLKTLIQQGVFEIHYFLLPFFLNPQGKWIFPVLNEMAFYNDPYFITTQSKRMIQSSIAKKKPFFLVSFYSLNHFPYGPRYPYYQMYSSKKYQGDHKYKKENLLSEYSQIINDADKKQIIDLYDSCVRSFDDEVAKMISFLKNRNLSDHTIVIIMSDHGENLYDLDYGMGHGDHLRGSHANRLTFGIYSPFHSWKGEKVNYLVRDIDIAPTILQLLNQEKQQQFSGVSLISPDASIAVSNDLPVYSETGIWFTSQIPNIEKGTRIPYPDLTNLLEVIPRTGEFVLKDNYRFSIVNAKHRAIEIGNYKFIYMPGMNGITEELYDTGKPQHPDFRIKDTVKKNEMRTLLILSSDSVLQLMNQHYLLEPNAHADNFLTIVPPDLQFSGNF